MKYINIEALEGKARAEAIVKAVDAQEMLIKAFVPGIRSVGYDEVARTYEAANKAGNDDAGFNKAVEDYLAKGAPAASKTNRIKEFVGSMETRDRDGDRIEVKGWQLDDYKKNSTFLWAHQYGGFPYATALRTWKDKEDGQPALKFWDYFQDDLSSAEAQAATDYIFALYDSKPPLAKAVSVGYKGIEIIRPQTEDEAKDLDLGLNGILFKKQNLLEHSGCPVGSHPDALLSTAKKMFGAKKGAKVLDALGMEIPKGKKAFMVSSDFFKSLFASSGLVGETPTIYDGQESEKPTDKPPTELELAIARSQDPALILTTETETKLFDEMTVKVAADGEPDGTDVQKPYENEHAARLQDPEKYEKFRRQNNKFAEGVHAIWGILKNGKVELQAIRFSKDKFTVAEAKAWLKKNEYKPIMFEPAKALVDELAGRVTELEKRLTDMTKALEALSAKSANDTTPQTGTDGTPGTDAGNEESEDLPSADPALEQDALVSYFGEAADDGGDEPTLYDVMGAE